MHMKFQERKFHLATEQVRGNLLSVIHNIPLNLEVIIREKPKQRKIDQQALMWVGPLKDLEQQGFIGGRSFTAEVWHHYCKQYFLPEQFDEELTLPGYEKWSIGPDGDRVLVGSTTQLTKKGFSEYLEQIYAMGSELGVMFSAAPNQS